MPERSRVVSWYVKELRRTKKDKPEEIKEALEIYIRLWERVLEKGTVRPDDRMDEALRKVDANGGLYRAAGD